jgi:hypothetical protein
VCPAFARVGIGEVRVRHGELAPGLQALEEGDRLAGDLRRLRRAAGTPEDLREPAKIVALLEHLPELPAAIERRLDRLDRLVVLVRDVARPGAPLEQLRAVGRREHVAEAERPRVLCCRLAVRAQRRSSIARLRRETEDGLGVAGGLGVVSEPSELGRAVRRMGERRERLSMQHERSVR